MKTISGKIKKWFEHENIKKTINQIEKYIPGESLSTNSKEKISKLSSNESPFKIPRKVINKVNSLNTKSEKSFPDNSDAYKIGKKYYESSKKEEPKTEYLNQRPYLDIQKVIQQEKDIKTFKKAKKKGLTFGGKKTKNNRKNSKRKTRKV